MEITANLDQKIRSVCPIAGVSIGAVLDKTTWRIDFAEGATTAQKSAAVNVMNSFMPTEETKRAEIEAAYNAAVSFLKDYPQSEQMSWGAQEAEARAFNANNSAATPTLSAIAARTGETVAVLASKVIANANAFKAGGGDAIGRRRARMKAIDAAVAANDMAALQAVVW